MNNTVAEMTDDTKLFGMVRCKTDCECIRGLEREQILMRSKNSNPLMLNGLSSYLFMVLPEESDPVQSIHI